jgi:hypothetical protein
MTSRPSSTEQRGSPASAPPHGCARSDAGAPVPFRWLWTAYVLLGVALAVAVRVSPWDLPVLARTLRASPDAARYDLSYDKSSGAWTTVTAEREGTRVRGGGYRDRGVSLVVKGDAFLVERLCAVDVAHVHSAPEADTELVVAFEAKHAAVSEISALVVEVADRYVTPEGDICTACWDQFGVRVPLTTEWHSFVIPLGSLRQEGWGRPARHSPDQSNTLSVAATIRGGGQFDLSLRDLRVARAARGSYEAPIPRLAARLLGHWARSGSSHPARQ